MMHSKCAFMVLKDVAELLRSASPVKFQVLGDMLYTRVTDDIPRYND